MDHDTKLALRLNLGCDLGDLIATLLEWRDGELPGSAAAASVVVQSTGMATWNTALRNL